MVCFITTVPKARAETVTVNLLELQMALDNASNEQDPVSRDILNRVADAIGNSELGFVNGELLYQNTDSNILVEGGCNRTVILQMDTDIQLLSDTALSLTLDSLYDPIVIQVNVLANVRSVGEARQIVGIRLGECQNLARESFLFDAKGPARFTLSATLTLNPEWTDDSTLSLYPRLAFDGELLEFSTTVTVDDTVLAGILENYIEDRINETFTNSRLSTELNKFETRSNDKLTQSLDNGRVDIELPEANDEQILGLYRLLQPDARFPVTLEFVRKHRQQLLSSLLFGEPTSTDAILNDAAICQSASVFLSAANPAPVYAGTPEQCTVVDPASFPSSSVYSDAACTNAINYKNTSISEYCDVALDPSRLGNAASLPSELGLWTHSPGSRFDIGALGVAGLEHPFMRRFRYKSIQTHRGLCELEMRVYSQSANLPSQRPLLALHGGSWQHRASGYIGVETTATHFTNNGFVVFAPFYRLIGESDGNVACNDASLADILDDVNDALDWVQSNQAMFNITGETTVFGQSAGGHLALSLATYRSAEIRRAILFYAPTDFEDFALQIKSGEYNNEAGLKILEAVTGNTIESLDTQSALVQANSFPSLIVNSPNELPPMFILHGQMDSLLPARQPVRLCNALSGSSDFNSVVNLANKTSISQTLAESDETDLASKFSCGINGSQLHLIAEGEHALDLCLAQGLCLSGSEQSADAVANSITRMLDWSSAETLHVENVRQVSTGLGAVYWSLLIILLMPVCTRRWQVRR